MEKLELYRQSVQALLTKYAQECSSSENVEVQLIFDLLHDRYLIVDVGWDEYDRIYNCVMHLDIKNNKIWIQQNMTDIQIAEKLVEMGIPREDIVLGLQPPYKRQYTQYGVA